MSAPISATVRKSIGDVCELVNGRAFKPTEWTNSGLPIIRIQNLNDESKTFNYFDGTYDPKHEVNNGDLLFSWSGTPGTSFGAFFWNRGRGVLNQHIFNVLVNPAIIEKRYLRYAMNNRLDEIIGHAHGGVGLQHITKGKLESIEIPLPPLSEQKRIADILDKADAIRRKRQEALKFRNHFLTSTFLDMFGDPATNPKNLPLRELSEFYVTPKDGTKCGPFGGALKKEEYTSTGVPVWNMDNISDDGSLVPNIRLWISQEKYEDLSSYSVKDGDVIISRAGTVGKMCVVRAGPKDSIISTNLIRLRLNSSLIPEFFVSLMVLFKGRAGRLKTGPDGAFTHMSTGVLDKITIPYPTVSAQGDYVSIMERMDRSTHRLTTAVTEADRLFNSLAQRAFKGEL